MSLKCGKKINEIEAYYFVSFDFKKGVIRVISILLLYGHKRLLADTKKKKRYLNTGNESKASFEQ